ncbi:hypothetical protein ABPG74_009647 [Tetrahymena malaccensis]
MIMKQQQFIVADADSQYLAMSQEFEENINDLENQIELELQIQNRINQKSDPILVIDNSSQSQQSILMNKEQLSLKRPFFKLEKENQFINTLNLPKSQNKFVKKDVSQKDILEEKKLNSINKKNALSIHCKQIQFQKKQLKIQEKQNLKQQKCQNECLRIQQNNFKISILNDIEIQQ